MIYQIYGFIHRTVKRLLNFSIPGDGSEFFYIYQHEEFIQITKNSKDELRINGEVLTENEFDPTFLFYGENTGDGCLVKSTDRPLLNDINFSNVEDAWLHFLRSAEVPDGWRNRGFLQCGYIKEKENWCLSSWIWTSAATARYYAKIGESKKCLRIADAFLKEQEKEGGWVVRYDYPKGKTVQVIAPNDSAYIANNALLSAFKLSNNEKYLLSACRCADWIIKTARDDGLVWISMDKQSGEWKKDSNIVDIGFTAGFFAELYVLTKKEKYKVFCERFVDTYIQLFWDDEKKLFYTALNSYDQPVGGYFARGQAWALEGLIPTYEAFHDDKIKKIIDELVTSLVCNQNKRGGWAYNFARPLMGEDCKGVPLIARNLWLWKQVTGNISIEKSVKDAYYWCVEHTAMLGECAGGIFAYSTEGAVVHDLYTETAFVYSSAYALELFEMMGGKK